MWNFNFALTKNRMRNSLDQNFFHRYAPLIGKVVEFFILVYHYEQQGELEVIKKTLVYLRWTRMKQNISKKEKIKINNNN